MRDTPVLESLFTEPHLQGFAADLTQLRTRDNDGLDPKDLIRLSRCVDQPHLAHADINYWDTLIVDRQRTFGHYLWKQIKDRSIGAVTKDDVLDAIHAAAEHVRNNDRRLASQLQHATFLSQSPPPQ